MTILLRRFNFCCFVFLLLVFSGNSVFGQSVGDYRSNVTAGNWTTLSSWQYYNGSTWVTPSGTSPQGYPGQYAGTGIVTIRNASTITISSSTPNNFSALVIGEGTSGVLVVGADIDVKTLDIIINANGIMTFLGQNEIHFPVNAGIKIIAPGKIDTSATCTNNVAIYIGTVKFGVCVGSGNAEFSFSELNQSGGSLFAVPTSNSPVCQGNSINLTGNYSGPAPTIGSLTYSWSIVTPTGSIITSVLQSPTITNALSGSYLATLTCNADYNGRPYSNSETISVTVNALPTTPTIGTITQPTCVLPTGSVVLSGLPASGTWTLTRSPGAVTTSGTGTSATISGLASGTYTYTVFNGSCTSVASSSVTITSPDKTWNGSISADWNTAANWTPSGVPTSSNCVTIPDVPLLPFPIISGTNFVAYANNLTVLSSGILTVKSSNTIIVTDFVDVDLSGGTLIFENTASLVQINNVTTKANSGFIDYQRITAARPTDYTYWSSPVTPMTFEELYPSGGTFYSYETTSTGEDWSPFDAGTDMVAGKGYIANQGAEVPSGIPPPPGLLDVTFVGVPNNGHYEINGIFAEKSYLLGNPYPSALDADEFLAANAAVLNGTLYFWTHNTQIGIGVSDPGTGLYAYSGDDYATYNATGGVGAAPPDLNTSTGSAPSGNAGNNNSIPSGKIASGQGFFASSKTSLSGTKIVFDNTMRVGVNGITGNNSQFFKTKNPNKSAKTIEKNRVWLNLTNTQGAFKQTLVGYITDATNGYDGRFDGESFDGNEFVDFYSVNQDKNLTIQGRALPFDENDEVPLGFRTKINGTFAINIDQADGLLTNQAVFIEDKLTNEVFDLKSGNYTFNTVAGTFNDRFVLKYSNKTLGAETFDLLEKTVLVSNKNKQIKINSSVEMINMVAIFDLLGRQIYQKANINSNELSISDLVLSHQIVMVKTVLQNGEIVTKKIIY